jgi:hypothetical protein
MVVLHCKNSYGNTFVIILIVSTHFQWCGYCKLGIEKKLGHVHNWCLYINMKVLFVNFLKIKPICSGLKHACGIWHSMIRQKYCKLGK